jgi:hypothetical protein
VIPYKARIRFDALGGVEGFVAVPVPLRGELCSLYIRQLVGVQAGAAFDLYDRPPLEEGVLSPLPDDYFSDESARVAGPFTIANGQSMFRTDFTPRKGFNAYQDTGNGSREAFLYLKATPGGTGAKSFELVYETMNFNPS